MPHDFTALTYGEPVSPGITLPAVKGSLLVLASCERNSKREAHECGRLGNEGRLLRVFEREVLTRRHSISYDPMQAPV